MPEKTESKLLHDVQCFRCREIKPVAHFRKNAAGAVTSWCETCRKESARTWGIEEDLVELAYGLHVYECWLRGEATVVAAAADQTGTGEPGAMRKLESGLRQYSILKHHRIPVQLGRFLRQYRADFFAAISMPAPEILIPEEADFQR